MDIVYKTSVMSKPESLPSVIAAYSRPKEVTHIIQPVRRGNTHNTAGQRGKIHNTAGQRGKIHNTAGPKGLHT